MITTTPITLTFSSFQSVNPDSAAELDLLKQLGKTSSLRGKHDKACGYYDQALAQLAISEDTLNQVEVHLLYSQAMFNLGDYDIVQDCDDAFCKVHRKGAQWHSEQAIKLLDTISGASNKFAWFAMFCFLIAYTRLFKSLCLSVCRHWVPFSRIYEFLDVSLHLYMRECRSVGPKVRNQLFFITKFY